MQRRIDRNRRSALWLERVVWNAAAGAALAIMVLVLLGSLQWLDRVAPRSDAERGTRTRPSVAGSPADAPDTTREVAGVNRPSG
ncbi:MAG: hypothetical protein CL908_04685 [Deltaproteobacteria bacterium]|jgi:hypothetical protein|nr:hypothetical protein [Deltaproteobacteria bacterium]